MRSGSSKFWGTVVTLGLVGSGLFFLFAMVEESRQIDNPMPVMAGAAVTVIYFALLRGPIGKAIARMLEDHEGEGELASSRFFQLEDRIAELSIDQQRITELEERLDFAERLLSQRDRDHVLPSTER